MGRILVVGTNNSHKLQELAPHLEGLGLALRTAGSFGGFDPVEDGTTLEANASIKAQAALTLSGEWSIADDTGLEVEALGGRPGIFAARYAGEGCSFRDNIEKLLGELRGVPEGSRKARFVCVIALARPGLPVFHYRGSCAGHILTLPRGSGGFGYDPVFRVEGLEKSFAELTAEEKNRISHRAQAARLLRAELLNLLNQEEVLPRP